MEYEDKPWCYTIIMGKRLREDRVNRLEQRFKTFQHYYTRRFYKIEDTYEVNKTQSIRKTEPTYNGLVFIQGDPDEIKAFLNEEGIEGVYLRNDCATKRTAVIPHSIMAKLIGLSKMPDVSIIFTEYDAPVYAKGRVLVRGISGIHEGLEGYIVRYHRDRRLVLSIGQNMTVAINGVNRSMFVNVEDKKEAERRGLITPM